MYRVSFDELEPYLGKSAAYKCTYDILRHTEPEDNDDAILVTWTDDLAGTGREVDVYGCSVIWTGDCLETLAYVLGQDIEIEDDIVLSEPELLARILWELTFDGFTPKNYSERDFMPATIRNSYDKRYWDMIYRHNRRYMDPWEKQEFFETNIISDWKSDYYRRKGRKMPRCKNRSKRKRDYRKDIMLHRLYRMGNVEDAVTKLLADGSTLTRSQLDWLFMTEGMKERSYQSYAYDRENRMSYLYDLLAVYNGQLFAETYYAPADCIGRHGVRGEWLHKKFTRFIVTLNVSPDFPLTEKEKEIYDKILALEPKNDIITGIGYDRSLGSEAEIIAVSASDALESEPYYFAYKSFISRKFCHATID